VRVRAGVILVQDDQVALIERVRDGHRYFVFPGGGVEPGETTRAAAQREAWEELGLRVRALELQAIVHFGQSLQLYFRGEVLGGVWGSGDGPEYGPNDPGRGTYRPVLVPVGELQTLDVRPRALANALAATGAAAFPLEIEEGRA
jgi:8-oxo-dGTP diphosphatase